MKMDTEKKKSIMNPQVQELGELLIQKEYIIPQDLEFALEHQRHTQEPLAEILVRMRALHPDDLAKMLSQQTLSVSESCLRGESAA